MVVCIKAMVGKKRCLVQFKDGQRRKMINCFLLFGFSEEKVGKMVGKTISDPPPLPHKCEG